MKQFLTILLFHLTTNSRKTANFYFCYSVLCFMKSVLDRCLAALKLKEDVSYQLFVKEIKVLFCQMAFYSCRLFCYHHSGVFK